MFLFDYVYGVGAYFGVVVYDGDVGGEGVVDVEDYGFGVAGYYG